MSSMPELSRAAVGLLSRLLQRSGLSQRQLGDLTGTSQATVSGFLNGRQPNWAIGTMVRMATALRHDVGIVLIPRGEPYRWCGDEQCEGRHLIQYAGSTVGTARCHGAPVR